jgi:DNA-binding NarL/FixJ family response regulator
MKLPRVILADDHKLVTEAFSKLLAPHCDVVATVSDGRALLDVAPALQPDVIVLDYRHASSKRPRSRAATQKQNAFSQAYLPDHA